MSVYKKILIILFSSFIGIISNPEMPLASDTVSFSDISGAVETVIVEKPVQVEPVYNEVSPVVETPVKSQPTVVETPAPTPVVAAPAPVNNHIDIAGRSIELVNVDNTAVDAGNHVNKFGSKFLYGHNSMNVFRVLYNVKTGDTFSITEGGVTKNYRVSAVAIYEKIDSYTLSLDGQKIKMSVVAKARYNGANYDLSLMTCYGQSYGNGDASHRLVVFANAI